MFCWFLQTDLALLLEDIEILTLRKKTDLHLYIQATARRDALHEEENARLKADIEMKMGSYVSIQKVISFALP